MKHFSTQTGGRHTYAEDVTNLQDLALAINAIFDGCDNFIVSGCEVKNNTISSGIVYINGELRQFDGASNINTWPIYLCESNATENVAYESGQQKAGRISYGVVMQSSAPSMIDPVTSKVAQYIKVERAGGLTLRDAFFGKYALLKEAAATIQEVKTKIKFHEEVEILKKLSLSGGLALKGACEAKIYLEGDSTVIEYQSANSKIYKLVMSESGGYQLLKDGAALLKVSDTIESTKDFKAPKVIVGDFIITGNTIYNTAITDEGAININLTSPNDNYRKTVIGDGKGTEIFTVDGKTASVNVAGTFEVSGGSSIILKSNALKSSNSLVKTVTWQDSSGSEIAVIGFAHTDNNSFEIKTALSTIVINSISGVDIKGGISEDGTPLKDKYVLKTDLSTTLGAYASKNASYTKGESDSKYGTKTGGFTQFMDDKTNTALALRYQIGAVSMSDVTAKCPTLANCLSDMAKDASSKEKIRNNIGAAPAGSYQEKLYDSGWISISGTELHARQIGKIVCIQGVITTKSRGTKLFTLPNNIDAPRYSVCSSVEAYEFATYIVGNTRECYSYRCNNRNENVYFSMTYMTA
jgi:hypothetical protein